MVSFPQQFVQAISIRDTNGNLIIQIGPSPDIKIMAPPPSQSMIEFNADSTTTFMVIKGETGIEWNVFADDSSPPTLEISQFPVPNSGCALFLIQSSSPAPADDGAIFMQARAPESGSARGVIFDGRDGFIKIGAFSIPTIVYETWTAATLQNGWTNFGGGYAPLQFKMLPHGFVHLEGTIKPGVTVDGTTVTTLPAGYRPPFLTRRVPITEKGIAMMADIQADGQVKVINTAGATTVSFCCDFPADILT